MRIDQYLLHKKYFESRKKAQVAISRGCVFLVRDGQARKILKSSEDYIYVHGDEWRILPSTELEFVSRSGAKLKGALDVFQKDVTGIYCLDIGISTGGFSEVLLEGGALGVVGVDVGQNQLHERLKNHPRLKVFEKMNAKETLPIAVRQCFSRVGQFGFDLIVIDVSFISLEKVLVPQLCHLSSEGEILALIKPQFEAGPSALNKKGLIEKNEGLLVAQKTVKNLEALGLKTYGFCESILAGEDGNQEYFIYCAIADRSP